MSHGGLYVQSVNNKVNMKVWTLTNVQGSASALHYQMDRAILSRHLRPAGLPGHRLGLDCHMNTDSTIDFVDILSRPEHNAEIYEKGPHQLMAERFGK